MLRHEEPTSPHVSSHPSLALWAAGSGHHQVMPPPPEGRAQSTHPGLGDGALRVCSRAHWRLHSAQQYLPLTTAAETVNERMTHSRLSGLPRNLLKPLSALGMADRRHTRTQTQASAEGFLKVLPQFPGQLVKAVSGPRPRPTEPESR